MNRPGKKPIAFRDVFCDHFYITTSGNFSTPALLCSMLEMGIDRILYSVDWPFVDNKPGSEWMDTVPLSREDRLKLASGNAEKLLKLMEALEEHDDVSKVFSNFDIDAETMAAVSG